MATLSRITAGQILWVPQKDRFGKTGHMRAKIIEVQDHGVIAEVNYNPPMFYGSDQVKKWKVNNPMAAARRRKYSPKEEHRGKKP